MARAETPKRVCKGCMIISETPKRLCKACMIVSHTVKRPRRCCMVVSHTVKRAVQVLHSPATHCERAAQVLHSHFTHCERAVQVLHSPATHCERAAQVLHSHFTHCAGATHVLHTHFTHCDGLRKGGRREFTRLRRFTPKPLFARYDRDNSPPEPKPGFITPREKAPRAPFGFDWAVTFGADFSERGGIYYCMRPTDELWKRDSSPMGGVQARKIYYNTTIEE